MIVAERKTFDSIARSIKDYKSILILGCGTCVTVCMSGGEKEVGLLSAQIRLSERDIPPENRHSIIEATIERQCDNEFIDPIKDMIEDVDCVLSMGCGVGVQHLSEYFHDKVILPALDTKFFGATKEPGIWVERCAGCGECILDITAGICPIARCSKSILNGPCGGSQDGKCEIDSEIECAWQLIIDRLEKLGRSQELERQIPIKDWSHDRHGGPRTVIREESKG